VALEAQGDFGAPGGVAELEKNLIDRSLLLNAEGEAHMQKRYRETSRAASEITSMMGRAQLRLSGRGISAARGRHVAPAGMG
jgi:hypothetical protein